MPLLIAVSTYSSVRWTCEWDLICRRVFADVDESRISRGNCPGLDRRDLNLMAVSLCQGFLGGGLEREAEVGVLHPGAPDTGEEPEYPIWSLRECGAGLMNLSFWISGLRDCGE